MAQVSYGTITIIDTNDIERIYLQYCRSTDNQLTNGEVAHQTVSWQEATPPWVNGQYIWQRSVIKKSGVNTLTYGVPVCLTGAQGQTGSSGQSLTATKTQYTHVASNVTITTSNHTSYKWTDNVPEYDSTKPVYWGRITNTYTNSAKTEYLVYKDNGLTDAIAQSVEANANASEALDKANEAESIAQQTIEDSQGAMSQAAAANVIAQGLQSQLKYMWTNQVNSVDYPAGSYMASGNDSTFSYSDSSTYGFNSFLQHTKIHFRYNAIDLNTLGLDGLKLYAPTITNDIITGSQLGLELTKDALKFYRPGTAMVDAQLTSSGLQITNGSIVLGSTSGITAGSVALSNTNFTRSINGTQRDDLRLAIGSKFGVSDSGTLYADGANIINIAADNITADTLSAITANMGAITAGSITKGNNSINFDNSPATLEFKNASTWASATQGIKYDSNGLAIKGSIVATSLSLGSGVTIPASTGISGLSTVATTGSYNDLSNKPTIPSLTGYIYQDGTVGNTPAEGATGFVVSSTGLLQASNAIIYGSLYASKGYIGGWQIGTDGNKSLHNGSANTSPVIGDNTIILSKGLTSSTTIAGSTGSQTWTIAAGRTFGVTTAGKLYATGADISGAITASSLTIQEQATIVDDDGLIDNGALPIEDLEGGIKTVTESSNDNLKYLMSIYVEDYTSNMIDPTDPDGQAILPLPKLNGEIDERKESSLINRNLVLINDNGISIRGTSAEQTTSLNITNTDMQFTTSSGTPILTIHAEEEETSYIDADMGQFEFVNMQNGECDLTWVARSNGHLTLKEV